MAPVQAALPGSPPTRPSPAGSWSLTPPPQGSPNGAPAMAMPSPPAGADARVALRLLRDGRAAGGAGDGHDGSTDGADAQLALGLVERHGRAPCVQRHAVSIKHDGAAPQTRASPSGSWTAAPPAPPPAGPAPGSMALAAAPNGTLEKVTVLQAQGSGILVKGRNDAQRVVPSVTELTTTPPTQGSKAYYEMMGKIEPCTVTTVHTDAAEPYYTVTLSNGSTRTTEAAHVLVPSVARQRPRRRRPRTLRRAHGRWCLRQQQRQDRPVPTERPRPLQAAQGLDAAAREGDRVEGPLGRGRPALLFDPARLDRCGKTDGRTAVGEICS